MYNISINEKKAKLRGYSLICFFLPCPGLFCFLVYYISIPFSCVKRRSFSGFLFSDFFLILILFSFVLS